MCHFQVRDVAIAKGTQHRYVFSKVDYYSASGKGAVNAQSNLSSGIGQHSSIARMPASQPAYFSDLNGLGFLHEGKTGVFAMPGRNKGL